MPFFFYRFLRLFFFFLGSFSSPLLLPLLHSLISPFSLFSFFPLLFIRKECYWTANYNDSATGGFTKRASPHVRRHWQAYPIVQYSARYPNKRDDQLIFPMRLVGYAQDICNFHILCMPGTAICAWIKRWWHWGWHWSTGSMCRQRQMDSLYICRLEILWYQQRLGNVLMLLWNIPYWYWQKDHRQVIAFSLHMTSLFYFQIGSVDCMTYVSKYYMGVLTRVVIVHWHSVNHFQCHCLCRLFHSLRVCRDSACGVCLRSNLFNFFVLDELFDLGRPRTPCGYCSMTVCCKWARYDDSRAILSRGRAGCRSILFLWPVKQSRWLWGGHTGFSWRSLLGWSLELCLFHPRLSSWLWSFVLAKGRWREIDWPSVDSAPR